MDEAREVFQKKNPLPQAPERPATEALPNPVVEGEDEFTSYARGVSKEGKKLGKEELAVRIARAFCVPVKTELRILESELEGPVEQTQNPWKFRNLQPQPPKTPNLQTPNEKKPAASHSQTENPKP